MLPKPSSNPLKYRNGIGNGCRYCLDRLHVNGDVSLKPEALLELVLNIRSALVGFVQRHVTIHAYITSPTLVFSSGRQCEIHLIPNSRNYCNVWCYIGVILDEFCLIYAQNDDFMHSSQ